MPTAGLSKEAVVKGIDAYRGLADSFETAFIIDDHAQIAKDQGLDGVHLSKFDTTAMRNARKLLGGDRIVGAFCGFSKHDGMCAGEIGADYVSFGPVTLDEFGEGPAEPALFEWWSQMIEVPLVAEGALAEAQLANIAPYLDFVTFGDEIWNADDPLVAFDDLVRAASGA